MATNPYINPSDYIQAERKSLGDIFLVHDRQFIVPLNQRPWAWKDAEDVQSILDDFWNIITTFFDPTSSSKWNRRKSVKRPPHFLGTFVFYQRPALTQLEIFDGQQRITAITMLCAVLREIAYEQMNIAGPHKSRAGDMYGGFNNWLRVSPSDSAPRLLPNSMFRGLFDALIFESVDDSARQTALGKLTEEQRQHAISKKLVGSFSHMRSWVREKTDSGTPTDITNFLVAAHDVLRYLFSGIETLILDEQYSYEVFGCLNTRGVNLTPADNIKNELFKVSDSKLHQTISETWERIGENVPGQDIGEFLRRRHIAFIGPCKKQQTYDLIKSEEIDKEDTNQLIESWHQDSLTLRRILQREASFFNKESLERLEYIFEVLDASLAYIPLLSAATAFLPGKKDEFDKCVTLTERFVFRTLTIGQMDTAELERKLGEAARKLRETASVSEFRDYLKSQADDIRFGEQFTQHQERRPKVQYYVLRELEKHRLGGGKGLVPGDHHHARNHIEHILPKNPSKQKARLHEWNWARANPDKHRILVNRLGNLLVLEGDINKSVGNHEFCVKQNGEFKKSKSGKISQIKCYKDSALPSTKELCDAKTWVSWTDAEIEKRQKEMAKSALAVWSI
ncbi:MAG: DUF262 domain-containing HNH endonuclease family protein [Alphaproteobacteria bacterium]